jgi:tetratricopeptide (TPR) repeat protein
VIYQNTPVQFRFSAAAPGAAPSAPRYPKPVTAYGFFGRDLDVLEIEHRLLKRGNLLLVQGMGGAGKSTLLHHLGWWWQKTRFVEQVFYFGYDLKAYRLPMIITAIGEQLGLPQSGRMQDDRAEVVRALKHTRHLLMLDNMESITGERLSIPNTLNDAERQELKGFLLELTGGRTLVLLGSRGNEEWLQPNPLNRHRIYDLPGLDGEASSQLADKILRDIGAPNYPDQPEHRDAFKRLMRLLGGYPLAMEVVLSNLARSTPAEVLLRLEAADIDLDNQSATAGKTDSIIKCIDYSHSNLSEPAQQLLLTLAPFTGVVNKNGLMNYSLHLLDQPVLTNLSCDCWDEVIKGAVGLIKPHEDNWLAENGYFSLQPVFPFFLKSRLNDPAQGERKEAIETAFREHYEGIGMVLDVSTNAKEAEQQQFGYMLIGVEYENIYNALQIALKQQESFLVIYKMLSDFLFKNHQYEQLFILGRMVQQIVESYPNELLKGEAGYELIEVLVENVGHGYMDIQQYQMAEQVYKKALRLFDNLEVLSFKEKEKGKADIFHSLGTLSTHLEKWNDAEQYYMEALQIYKKYDYYYARARTLHQLGMLFQEKRMLDQAKRYYLNALDILKEYNYRYDQAKVLHQLGIVAHMMGCLAEAEMYYKESLLIKIEYNDFDERARTLQNLGVIAQQKRQWAKAEKYYKEALAIKIEYNLRYEQASSFGQLGLLAEDQNKWDEAQAYTLEIAAIFIEFDDTSSLGSALLSLSRIWKKTKNRKLVEKLAALLNSSAADCEALLDEAAGASESGDGKE